MGTPSDPLSPRGNDAHPARALIDSRVFTRTARSAPAAVVLAAPVGLQPAAASRRKLCAEPS